MCERDRILIGLFHNDGRAFLFHFLGFCRLWHSVVVVVVVAVVVFWSLASCVCSSFFAFVSQVDHVHVPQVKLPERGRNAGKPETEADGRKRTDH